MQSVKLNLIPGSVMPVVNVSQYDKNRQFALVIYEGASQYSLTGKSVQIRGTKPDGNGFAYDSTDGVVSVSGSTVTISTTQQMTAVGGQTMAELRITQSGVILGTLNFVLMVEPSALSDDTPISDTDIPAIERDFEAALAEAEADALKAEGYAVGTQEGVPAQSGEPYYEDNAKYYKEQAEAAASGGGADALKAEGYAVGTQNGVPVTSGSPYYHNNAAYYEGEASTSATNAATSETNAGLSETAAGNSATNAAADALEAEGWAVGEQGGTPVGPTSPYYENNARYYCQQSPHTALTSLTDVDISSPSNDQVLKYDNATQKWVNGTGGGGASDLDDLTDVTLTNPASGQVLEYDGSKWANANLPTVPADLDDLSDVTLSSPTSGQFLKYDGSKWVNGNGGGGASALDDLTDVDITTPTDGQVLTYDAISQKWINAAGGGANYKTMTVKINLSDSNPATWAEYTDDAVGMTAGAAAWDTFFGHYPAMIKNGAIVGELDPTQGYAKYTDGTTADITSGADGDVMIVFPRRGLKIWIDNGYLYISMTDDLGDIGYKQLAHKYGSDYCDWFALGRYKGYSDGSKLRSLSGKTPTTSQTLGAFRTLAQTNGTGYEQTAYYQLMYIQAMYMLKYCGQNPQSAVGAGYTSTSNTAIHTTGGSNSHGLDYGESSGTSQCSLFGIEDAWGNLNEWIDGIIVGANRQLTAATGNYNDSGTGYTAITDKTGSVAYGGYLRTPLGTTEGGFAPDITTRGTYGTDSTYFCDDSFINTVGGAADFGGAYSYGGAAGLFRLGISYLPSATHAARGARLMFMHVAS